MLTRIISGAVGIVIMAGILFFHDTIVLPIAVAAIIAVMLFELDIDSLVPYKSRTNKFEHLPEYPMNDYDVSVLFDTSVKWNDIHDVIMSKSGPDSLLRSASFVEEYKGKQVPDGKKSVTIRLVIGSLTKTLTSDEIESCANAVTKRLVKQLGAELRFK